MKIVHEDRYIFERIRNFLTAMLAKQFCILMDRYYQSVIDYRDKCKIKLTRQLEFGMFTFIFLYSFFYYSHRYLLSWY